MSAARPLREIPAKPLRKKSLQSLLQILRTPALRDRVLPGPVEFNEMLQAPTINRVPLEDHHVTHLREEIELHLRDHQQKALEFGRDMVHEAIDLVARENPFHPVEEYLCQLEWDGIPRIGNLLEDVLDAPGTNINQTLLRCWLISAVARVLRPGCKADGVLILQGAQGAGKSTFFAILAGPFFSDTAIDIGSKDAALACSRAWILEMGEMAAISKKDLETVKAFITSGTDDFRPPYGRRMISISRRCVFGGSSNPEEILHDPTGNRRFWVIPVGSEIATDVLAMQRDQIWAEAVHAFNQGEHWHLDRREQEQLAEAQERFISVDPWTAPVLGFMRETVLAPPTMAEILEKAVEKPRGQQGRADQMRVSAILAQAGYKKTRSAVPGERAVRWVRQ